MSSCKIISTGGKIQQVKAPNGRESQLYKDLVKALYGEQAIGENFQEDLDNAPALEEYSKVYTDNFVKVFGDWNNRNILSYSDFIDVDKVTKIIDYDRADVTISDLGNIRLKVIGSRYTVDDIASMEYLDEDSDDISELLKTISGDSLGTITFQVYDRSSNANIQTIYVDVNVDNNIAKISYNFPSYQVDKESPVFKEIKRKIIKLLKALGVKNVSFSEMAPNSRQGIGEAAYLLLADMLRSAGMTLVSDTNRSDEAGALWNKLVKKGLARFDEFEDRYFMVPLEEIHLNTANIGKVDYNNEPLLFNTEGDGYYYVGPDGTKIYVKREDQTSKDLLDYIEEVDKLQSDRYSEDTSDLDEEEYSYYPDYTVEQGLTAKPTNLNKYEGYRTDITYTQIDPNNAEHQQILSKFNIKGVGDNLYYVLSEEQEKEINRWTSLAKRNKDESKRKIGSTKKGFVIQGGENNKGEWQKGTVTIKRIDNQLFLAIEDTDQLLDNTTYPDYVYYRYPVKGFYLVPVDIITKKEEKKYVNIVTTSPESKDELMKDFTEQLIKRLLVKIKNVSPKKTASFYSYKIAGLLKDIVSEKLAGEILGRKVDNLLNLDKDDFIAIFEGLAANPQRHPEVYKTIISLQERIDTADADVQKSDILENLYDYLVDTNNEHLAPEFEKLIQSLPDKLINLVNFNIDSIRKENRASFTVNSRRHRAANSVNKLRDVVSENEGLIKKLAINLAMKAMYKDELISKRELDEINKELEINIRTSPGFRALLTVDKESASKLLEYIDPKEFRVRKRKTIKSIINQQALSQFEKYLEVQAAYIEDELYNKGGLLSDIETIVEFVAANENSLSLVESVEFDVFLGTSRYHPLVVLAHELGHTFDYFTMLTDRETKEKIDIAIDMISKLDLEGFKDYTKGSLFKRGYSIDAKQEIIADFYAYAMLKAIGVTIDDEVFNAIDSLFTKNEKDINNIFNLVFGNESGEDQPVATVQNGNKFIDFIRGLLNKIIEKFNVIVGKEYISPLKGDGKINSSLPSTEKLSGLQILQRIIKDSSLYDAEKIVKGAIVIANNADGYKPGHVRLTDDDLTFEDGLFKADHKYPAGYEHENKILKQALYLPKDELLREVQFNDFVKDSGIASRMSYEGITILNRTFDYSFVESLNYYLEIGDRSIPGFKGFEGFDYSDTLYEHIKKAIEYQIEENEDYILLMEERARLSGKHIKRDYDPDGGVPDNIVKVLEEVLAIDFPKHLHYAKDKEAIPFIANLVNRYAKELNPKYYDIKDILMDYIVQTNPNVWADNKNVIYVEHPLGQMSYHYLDNRSKFKTNALAFGLDPAGRRWSGEPLQSRAVEWLETYIKSKEGDDVVFEKPTNPAIELLRNLIDSGTLFDDPGKNVLESVKKPPIRIEDIGITKVGEVFTGSSIIYKWTYNNLSTGNIETGDVSLEYNAEADKNLYTVSGDNEIVKRLVYYLDKIDRTGIIISNSNKQGWDSLRNYSIPYNDGLLFRPFDLSRRYGQESKVLQLLERDKQYTASEVLGIIQNNDKVDYAKKLAGVLSKYKELADNTTVIVKSHRDFITEYLRDLDNLNDYQRYVFGYYKVDSNQIALSEVLGNEVWSTAIHEILHSMTHSKLKDSSISSVKFINFYNRVKQELERSKSPLLQSYAMSNVDEFIVGIFTDSDFQRELSLLPPIRPSEDIRNLWDEVIVVLGDLLGISIKDVSLLHDSFDMAMRVIESAAEKTKSEQEENLINLTDADILPIEGDEYEEGYTNYPLSINYSTEMTDTQKKLVSISDRISQDKRESVRMSAEELREAFPNNKNIKSLLKFKDGLVRNVFYDRNIGKEITLSTRPSDAGQIVYASKRGYDKKLIAQENDNERNIILRGMGTTLHKVLELLIKDIDRQNENFDIVKPDPKLGPYTRHLETARAKIIAGLASTTDDELKAIVEALNASGSYSMEQSEDQLLDPGSTIKIKRDDRMFTFARKDFDELIDLAYKMYHAVYEKEGILSWQSDTIHRPIIKTEATVVDIDSDTMGSVDLLAFYSNGKIGHFDYKFISFAKQMSLREGLSPSKIAAQGSTFVTNPKTKQLVRNKKNIGLDYREEDVKGKFYSKKEAYERSMVKYKEMLIKQYNVSPEDIVDSKIIPVNIVLDSVQTSSGYKPIPRLKFLDHKDKLMREISVANELSGDAKLDSFIKQLDKKLISLQLLADKRRGDLILREEIDALSKNLTLLRGKRDIAKAGASMLEFANRISTMLETPIGEEGYMTMADLNRAQEIVELYKNLREASRSEMKRLENTLDPIDYENTMTILDQQNSLSDYVLDEIIRERDKRILDFAIEADRNESLGKGRIATFEGYEISTSADYNILKRSGVGTESKLSELPDITYLGSMFSSLSEQQHPHLKLFKDLMDNINTDVKEYVDEMVVSIKKATDELEKWASSQGMTIYEAYEKIINPTTGNLISEYKKELYSTITEMRDNQNTQGLRNLIELDVEAFDKKRKRYLTAMKRIHGDDTTKIDEKMKAFDEAYDMRISDDAVNNPRNYMWKLREDKKASWESDMWKYMKNHKPLFDFYKYHIKVMESISSMVGTDHDIRDNFVANVSKDMVDSFVQNGIFSLETMSDLWHSFASSFKMRDNDEDFGVTLPDNSMLEEVPLMFSDSLPGGLKSKSKDLGKSLLMMAYSSKLYSASKSVEGLAQGLKVSLASTKLFKTGTFGKVTDERIENTEDSKTFKTLDGMIKMYLYGQRIQSGTEIVFGNKAATKAVNNLMGYASKLSLGWNYLSIIGGHLGAKAQIMQLASSGKYFDSKQHRKAETLFASYNKNAQLLSELFEISSEGNSGLIHEKANTMSKSFLRNKWNKSMAYIWQRKSDDAIDDTILYAMSMNYYLHPNGVDVFPKSEAAIYLKGTPYDIKDLKSIWESIQEAKDSENNKVWDLKRADGNDEITKTQFIKFRNKVKNVSAKAKGNYAHEDAYMYKTNLLMRMMMQYRGWIPAMVRERVGASRYNSTLEEIERARFSTFFSEVTDALDGKVKRFLQLSGYILADAATFSKFKLAKPDEASLANSFNKWKMANPLQYAEALKKYKNFENPEAEVMKEWRIATERELRELATEIRTYMMALAAMWLLMFGAGDDEREKNPLVRTTVKIIDRVSMEIGFFFSPSEFLNIARRSPLPIVNLLGDSMNLIKNTTQETLDFLGGADEGKTISMVSPGDEPFSVEFGEQRKDSAGPGKYFYRMFPIARGLDGLLEFTENPKERNTFTDWLFGLDDETVYKK